ncbi:MAG: hypothetical protein A2Z49_11605 [Chloroflexi bacterium RBG_19FT_COMBO_56_12]|nr:MAG: hypothetical protein A2W36_07120 [Chloroflexi bacterium RBG_16_58_14]OGO70484.1 MAG: hypothetical protein A2Z49_11605 [Chloroflexi bacterium RBG_19FT_COMBO_56_12]
MDKIWNIPEIQLIPLAEVHEPRPVLLITCPADWERVRARLRLPLVNTLQPIAARLEHWETLMELLGDLHAEVVYAVGNALAIDTARYLAEEYSLPLVCIPTALDTDAFLTHTVNIQEDGCVRTMPGVPAQRVVVDFEIVATAPAERRARGLSNVLSLATAAWDWKLAEQRGKNLPGKGFNQYLYDQTQAILHGATECAPAAGRGDPDGLKQLLDCLCLEVQLRNQAGHDRLAKGSEHYFAYAAQNLPEVGLEWQEFIGQGILLAAEWQGQDRTRLEGALRAAGILVDRVRAPEIAQLKKSLPGYCKQHKLDYGIAHEI